MQFITRATALLLALLALGSPLAANAQLEGLTRWSQTADRFERLAIAATARGAPPRASDPEVAAVLRSLTDREATFGGGPLNQEELLLASQMIQRLPGLANHYTEFAVQNLSAQARARQTDRNIITYQQELVPMFTFMIDSMGVMVTSVDHMAGQADAAEFSEQQIGGMRQVRNGVTQAASGMILIAAAEGMTPEHRLALVTALERNAATFAAALTPSQRSSVVATAQRARAQLGPQAREMLDRSIGLLSIRTCTRICAM
jgi:hypothetical protein